MEQCRVRPFWELMGTVLIFLQFLATASGHRNNPDALMSSIGEMTQIIILKYFRNATCVGVITEKSPDIVEYIPKSLLRYLIQVRGKDSSISDLEESDTLNYAILNNGTLKFEGLLIESLNAGCPVYVIQVSNPKAVVHCFARASRRAMFRGNRQYLYLPFVQERSDVSDSTGSAEDMFKMKEMDYMPDLLVAKVVRNEDKAIEIKVDDHFKLCNDTCFKTLDFCNTNNSKQRECAGSNSLKIIGTASYEFEIELRTHRFTGSESSESMLLDIWIPGTCGCSGKLLKSADLFPEKTRDVKGKELNLVTWYYPPFVILDFDACPTIYDGIEFRIVLEFMRYINSSFRLNMDPENYWGDVFDNGTGNGVLGFVAMDQADIGFSAFYAWPSSFSVVDFPSSHMRSSVTMITPRPKLMPGWIMPLMPFSNAMWSAVGACLVGATYTLYKLQRFADKYLGMSI